MKKIKMLTVFLLMLTMAFAFAGCGDSGDAGDDSVEISGDGAATGVLSFETTDLDGNAVNSEELFAGNELTMVNIWGTFCGPCIDEMPELEELHQKYEKDGVAIVGLVIDVPEGDDSLLQDAKDIVADTGVTYMSMRAWDGCDSELSVSAVPMTYFVDREGNIVGEPIVGADPEGYSAAIDDYLNQ